MNIYTVEHYTINPNWTLRPIRLSRAPYQYKPRDALYTSPLGSEYSWAQWCKENDYELERYRVELEVDLADAVVIDGPDDLPKLAWVHHERTPMLKDIAYWQMRERGVTAVWLTAKGELTTRFCDPVRSLYGWDCETVAILDERIIRAWTVVSGAAPVKDEHVVEQEATS